jgi:hypothetical protein
MPSISSVVDVEVDFSVYCATCGCGLCGDTDVKGDNIYVSVCPDCMAEKEQEIADLKTEIEALEEENSQLRSG